MTRPEDIPEDVWGMARQIVRDFYAHVDAIAVIDTSPAAHVLTVSVARALLAYGQSRADEATERAARVCEEQASAFLSPEYASGQPMSSLAERFACSECADAIRSQK